MYAIRTCMSSSHHYHNIHPLNFGFNIGDLYYLFLLKWIVTLNGESFLSAAGPVEEDQWPAPQTSVDMDNMEEYPVHLVKQKGAMSTHAQVNQSFQWHYSVEMHNVNIQCITVCKAGYNMCAQHTECIPDQDMDCIEDSRVSKHILNESYIKLPDFFLSTTRACIYILYMLYAQVVYVCWHVIHKHHVKVLNWITDDDINKSPTGQLCGCS